MKGQSKDGSGSNNSLVGIGGINGDNTIKRSFDQLNTFEVGEKNEAKKYGKKNILESSFGKLKRKVEDMQEVDDKNASTSNNNLVGIGVIIRTNTIKFSFNQLGTFKVAGDKLEGKKENGSGSKNSPVRFGVINGEKTRKNDNELEVKENGGSNNSLVGIGVINGKNTIEDSFKEMKTFKPPGKP